MQRINLYNFTFWDEKPGHNMKTHWARTTLDASWLVRSYGSLQARDIIITKTKWAGGEFKGQRYLAGKTDMTW